jgi:ParB family chromosome partitioning protein
MNERTAAKLTADEHRPRLGRGLAALIGDTGEEMAALSRARGQKRVPVAYLKPNPRNPRTTFAPADLDELTESIREKGVLQPILVRTVAGAADSYEIIAGERRWRAAQRAGLHDVPIIVVEADDKQALELAIIENVQRADLNPLEEAIGYQRLAEEFAYQQADLAKVIGKSRSHVANMLRLLKLPPKARALVGDGQLSAGHARALLALPDADAVVERIVREGWSVRDVERLGQKPTAAQPRARRAKPVPTDPDTRALEKAMSDALGLAVSIHGRGEAGELRIAYRTLEQLDAVCAKLRR